MWLSWYITRRFVLFAMEQQLLDIPNSRSSHSVVTPRGGGISFVVVLLGSTIALALLHRISFTFAVGILAGGIVAYVGYLDDCHGLSIKARLIVQLVASAVAVYCLVGFPISGTLPSRLLMLVGFLIATVCFTWLINLVNFMDGIDGLAASEAASVASICCALSVMHSGFHIVSLLFGVFGGAIIGFLVWNWSPAHIFMGDAGSCFLGFSLGALALLGAKRQELSLWVPVILLGVFAIDATMTLAKRFIRGEQWYKPHRLHAFQHAAQVFGHSKVTMAVVGINLLWLAPIAFIAQAFPEYGPLLLVGAWTPIVAVAYLFHAGEVLTEGAIPRWRTVVLILAGTGSHARPRILQRVQQRIRRNLSVFKAILVVALSVACTYIALVSEREGVHRPITLETIGVLTVFSIVQIFTILAFGLHRSHWHLLSIEEVPNIVGMSLAATLFGGLSAMAVSQGSAEVVPVSEFALQALLLIAAIVVAQMLAVAVSRFGHGESTPSQTRRVVIYGADAAGVGISSDVRRPGTGYRLVGFVDGRKAMRGIQIAGGHVLGADSEIRRLVDTYKVDEVLISAETLHTKNGQSFVRQCRSESIDFRIVPSVESGFKARSEAKRSSAAA